MSANLSNDECSVGSEILDRHSESFSVNAGDVIQVRNWNNFKRKSLRTLVFHKKIKLVVHVENIFKIFSLGPRFGLSNWPYRFTRK